MTKQLLTLFFLSFLLSPLFAQVSEKDTLPEPETVLEAEEVKQRLKDPYKGASITLRSGVKHVGTITRADNQKMKIIDPGNNEYSIVDYADIDMVETEKKTFKFYKNGRYLLDKGTYQHLLFHIMYASVGESYASQGICLNYTLGKLDEKYGWGIGSGLDFIKVSDPENDDLIYTFVPVYGEIKTNMMKGDVKPYASLNVGVTLPFDLLAEFDSGQDERYSIGAMAKAALGLQFSSRKRSKFTVELGYRMNYFKSVYNETFNDNTGFGFPFGGGGGATTFVINKKLFLNRVNIGLGYSF